MSMCHILYHLSFTRHIFQSNKISKFSTFIQKVTDDFQFNSESRILWNQKHSTELQGVLFQNYLIEFRNF